MPVTTDSSEGECAATRVATAPRLSNRRARSHGGTSSARCSALCGRRPLQHAYLGQHNPDRAFSCDQTAHQKQTAHFTGLSTCWQPVPAPRYHNNQLPVPRLGFLGFTRPRQAPGSTHRTANCLRLSLGLDCLQPPTRLLLLRCPSRSCWLACSLVGILSQMSGVRFAS
ncbi:hypothetical protein K469DRAFT_113071 [Zopfia rhizophila CBS 207.26]|uniref:Uncharacterized protein n=1 Tax=Zopfia rhizophila CBS 207.26 TaxID=1314779 RepID=A0A6A6EA07_9PEZI|nr:hypothetical protein K469DRAFT_113071 [Zopfia rhizophila CBS 207.26]